MDVKTIQAAAARIKGSYVLIGTAAMWLRGYDVDPHDIDFLVTDPQTHIGHCDEREPASTANSVKSIEDGVPVDYVFADEDRAPFMAPPTDTIAGVTTASVETVLTVKQFAGRPKDREFIRRWYSDLIAWAGLRA